MMNYKKQTQVAIPPQKVEYDPKCVANVKRARNVSPTGDSNPVKGSGAARKQKDVTWY